MTELGQYESPKSEVFISFDMEFKLKTSENHLKLSCYVYLYSGTVRARTFRAP
jgi:hypothetical protein